MSTSRLAPLGALLAAVTGATYPAQVIPVIRETMSRLEGLDRDTHRETAIEVVLSFNDNQDLQAAACTEYLELWHLLTTLCRNLGVDSDLVRRHPEHPVTSNLEVYRTTLQQLRSLRHSTRDQLAAILAGLPSAPSEGAAPVLREIVAYVCRRWSYDLGDALPRLELQAC
jgi:hypothetical protein